MATYIFEDISKVKEFVGGGANVGIRMESIKPIIYSTAQEHIIPWLSETLWDQLVATLEGPPSTEDAALLPYVQRATALLTFYEYSKIGGISFGESGIYRTENEHHKSAFKYQENSYREFMLNKGYEALELMIKFLKANEGDYPLWTADTAYTRATEHFINYASDFRNAYGKHISRYTFEILLPIIDDLEAFAILPLVGQQLFDDLKAKIVADTLNTEETEAVGRIQRAIAYFAIKEGTKRLWVRIDGKNVVQTEKLEPQSYEKAASPGAQAISVSMLHDDEFGNRHINSLKKYLKDNVASFPLYQAWLDALEAAAEEEEQEDERLELKCGCYDACSCATTNKAVVRL